MREVERTEEQRNRGTEGGGRGYRKRMRIDEEG